jgi:hypothetical protein
MSQENKAPSALELLYFSFGATVILFYSASVSVLPAPVVAWYHDSFPLRTVASALLIDIAGLTLIFWGVLALANRSRDRATINLLLAALIPPMAIIGYNRVRVHHLILAYVITACLLFILSRLVPKLFHAVLVAGKLLLLAGTVYGLLTVAFLGRALFAEPPVFHPAPMIARTPEQQLVHPRAVWILFDELSYRQVYEHRFENLQLPNFDRLAAISTNYTDVQPTGMWTEEVLPSLITGRPITKVRYGLDRKLEVEANPEPDVWQAYDPDTSIFSFAEQHGWNTGIVGWYNPYCGVMTDRIQRCYWENVEIGYGGTHSANSVGRNALRALQALFYRGEMPDPELANAEDSNLIARSLDAMQEQDLDFIFIHLELPHPSPERRSYIDNLVMTDKVLGRVLDSLQASPRWPNTTIVVNGDHSWRTAYWRKMGIWTERAARATDGGKFDTRPGLIVHHAGQTQPAIVSDPISIMAVHQILTDVITGASYSMNGSAQPKQGSAAK